METPHNGTPVTSRARRRAAGLVGLAVTLVLVVSGCGTGGGSAAASDAATSLDFRSETVGGERFDGAALVGKPTVLWFWAPWCPTCRAQISVVGDLAETYGPDVNVVGVGSLDEPEALERFAAEVSPDVTLLADPDGDVWRQFGVTAQSTYLVLDAAGDEQASGYLDDSELVDLVEDLAG